MRNMTPRHRQPAIRRVAGFTLIESLIALLVLSIGLLGVAAMQLMGLRANNGAYQRTQATFLAQDIADRMRANRGAALNQQYDFNYGDTTPNVDPVAQNDITTWRTRLATTLPAGASGLPGDDPDASIDVDPATNIATITIQWDDTKGAEALLEFVMRTRI